MLEPSPAPLPPLPPLPSPQVGAIVLAGGESRRMGRDKALLPFHGVPLIAHIVRQLEPLFPQLLISSNQREALAFLPHPVVPDRAPGQGPLMGLVSALGAAPWELSFVVACDIPTLPLEVIQALYQRTTGVDVLIPKGPEGRLEPLFAFYRKSALPALETTLASGQRRLLSVMDNCRAETVTILDTSWLRNLNTPDELAKALDGAAPPPGQLPG